MNSPLSTVARQANDYAAGWLNRQPAVKEESITDWLLDYFDQNCSDVRYYEFDRHEEARLSGADWDWWFLVRTGCFKVRVQAKKLRRGKDHYHDLARANQGGYQIDVLLESSAKYNFYPLYAVYGMTEGVERCTTLQDPTVLSVCAAHETHQLIFGSARRRIESKDVLALTIPLECVFSCPLTCGTKSNGPENLFRNYFQETAEGRVGYEPSVPSIIRSLFESRVTNSNTESALREYQSMFAGSRSVKILKVDQEPRVP